MSALTAEYRSRYFGAPDRLRIRVLSLSLVGLLHLALLVLLYGGTLGLGQDPKRARGGAESVNAFELSTPPAIAEAGSQAGSGQSPAATARASHEIREVPAGTGQGAGTRVGDAALSDALAGALADDPLAGGGGAPSYDEQLRRHLARFTQQPDRINGGRRNGVVVVRFRIERGGRVVDARVLRTQGPSLDEAALATLWKAEPLPAVPSGLPSPLEVDVPIDFRVSG